MRTLKQPGLKRLYHSLGPEINLSLTISPIHRSNRKFTKMTDVLTQPRPIRLKGRSFLTLALTPELPFEDWLVRLDDLAARSAGFFLRRPVVLDVEGLDIDRTQLRDLVDRLGTRNVRIMGIEGAKPSLLGLDLPPGMTDGREAPDVEAPISEQAKKVGASENIALSGPPTGRITPSIVLTQPVRSGQSLVFPEGDVTVVGSVASGAEIVAGGSIHIYGTLRGRAMAGTTGNASARIFCRKLEAELIAIDGFYKTAEDMEELRGRSVQVWLEGEAIKTGIIG
ncbi:septum site-determining protein MinC [Mesorhizobium albiziae]|uniref:Probable septum site-determining protein MinC n=2 Tax=Neomesorhizobium albiziae TaxID=335020 RepID=A0A1I4CSQ1_9HYPH|nr:septum site-determining protein MinC [Mesorhizobium albiziae]